MRLIKTKNALALKDNSTPFDYLFREGINVMDTSTIQAKTQFLVELSKGIDRIENNAENEAIPMYWGSIGSGLTTTAVILGAVTLNPIMAALTVSVSVVSAIAAIGSAVYKHQNESPVIEELKRYRLALKSKPMQTWANVWHVAGTDYFLMGLSRGSTGAVFDNELVRGRSTINEVIDTCSQLMGVDVDEFVEMVKKCIPAKTTKSELPTSVEGKTQGKIQDSTKAQESVTVQDKIQDSTTASSVSFGESQRSDRAEVRQYESQSSYENTTDNTADNSPDLVESIVNPVNLTLIVGVPGVGKGIFVSNALEAIKNQYAKVTVFYVDPKNDQKETGYFSGRVDRAFRRNIIMDEAEETYEWIRDVITEYNNFDAGTGIKLLVIDELAALYSTLSTVKGAAQWLRSKMSMYASSGSSCGAIVWGISQNAHVSGIGFDGGARSIFTPVVLISGDNIAASEQILKAQIIPSDLRLTSAQIKRLCAKSPVNRAVFHGRLNKWFPMQRLTNYSGFNRDKREFENGQTQNQNQSSDRAVEIKDGVIVESPVEKLERIFKTGEQPTIIQNENKDGDNEYLLFDCIEDKLYNSDRPISYEAIRSHVKRLLPDYAKKELIDAELVRLKKAEVADTDGNGNWFSTTNK